MFTQEGMASSTMLGEAKAFTNSYCVGFVRHALRSETARNILGGSPVTQNFWSEVTSLTAQISTLLKPLTDYLYHLPVAPGVQVPELRDQYQSLHNLISSAAYLSLCIRLSPTIFSFTDAMPGTVFDPDNHFNLEMEIYSQSQQTVISAAAATLKTHRKNVRQAHREVARLTVEGASQWKLSRAQRCLAAFGHEPLPAVKTHCPMAKIGVWPGIRRYKAASVQERMMEGQNKFRADKDGIRFFDVSRVAVVCYFGPYADALGDRVSLVDFVREKERLYGTLYQRCRLSTTVGFVFLTGLTYLFWKEEVQEKTGFEFGDIWENFRELLGRTRDKIR